MKQELRSVMVTEFAAETDEKEEEMVCVATQMEEAIEKQSQDWKPPFCGHMTNLRRDQRGKRGKWKDCAKAIKEERENRAVSGHKED